MHQARLETQRAASCTAAPICPPASFDAAWPLRNPPRRRVIMPCMPAPRQAYARPADSEYASYYHKYVSLVTTDDILGALESQRLQTSQLLAARSERDGNFRYAPGTWSVKEVIGHLSDAERIFSYRALRIARGDTTPLASFEQEDYVRGGNFAERALADLSEEFSAVRAASSSLF